MDYTFLFIMIMYFWNISHIDEGVNFRNLSLSTA